MAKRSFQVATWTPTATADTSAMANNTYMCIGANNSTSGLLVSEVYAGGQAGASSPTILMFARDSTLSGTPTALAAPASDGPLNSLSPVTQVGGITNNFAGTGPQRSVATTGARLNLSLNAFGGIVRWVAYPGEEWGIIGVTASISESTLSAYTGGTAGLMGTHIIYETYGA